MVIDFQKIDFKEKPILILKNLDGEPIQTLGFAFNISVELAYNEVSTLSFELPSHVDGIETPHYEDVKGMRLVDLKDYGLFILVDPKEESDGIRKVKSCTAYSLEYEFTKKKIAIENGTYNFWNPLAKQDTIIGIILEEMPDWRANIDSRLIGKYRTFEVTEENIYDFMKNTLQDSYGCIFDFDTYNRVIHVVSTATPEHEEEPKPIYLSSERLIKKIEIEEDSDTIVTCLDVNGAEGVSIRSVNPTGTNKIYNLDYFMNRTNFTQELIDKWEEWQLACESQQQLYFDMTMDYNMQVAKRLTEEASLKTLKGELTALENIQAVTIQAIAQGLNKTQADLDAVNTDITDKKSEISAKENAIDEIKIREDDLLSELAKTNATLAMKNYFTDDEIQSLRRYFIEDYMEDETFVAAAAQSYTGSDISDSIENGLLHVDSSVITQTNASDTKDMYSISDGNISITNLSSLTTIEKPDGTTIYYKSSPPSNPAKGDLWYATGQSWWPDGRIRGSVWRLPREDDINVSFADRVMLSQSFCESNAVITHKTAEDIISIDEIYGGFGVYSTAQGNLELLFSGSTNKIYDGTTNAWDTSFYGKTWTLSQSAPLELVNESNPFHGAVLIRFFDMFEPGKAYEYSEEKGWTEVDASKVFYDNSIASKLSRGTVEFNNDNTFVFTAHLGKGTAYGQEFGSANISIAGTYSSLDTFSDRLHFIIDDTNIYFTKNTTAYEQHAVEKDLYEYGTQVLYEKSQPTYSFNVDSGNFLSIDDFVSFKNNLELGKRIYLKIDDGSPLHPYVIGLKIEFEKMEAISLEFSNQYASSDRAFKLAKLLEQSVSMGKKLSVKSGVYSEFVNSGANTSVKSFMESALDIAKNTVLSRGHQAIEFGDAGIRVRKWADEAKTAFEKEQIWIVDNMIAFTDDNWSTAKMAIGKFKDDNMSSAIYGIVAEYIVGTILAGENLVIESSKKDGDISVFRVDASGAFLHNAELQVLNNDTQIVLNPDIGFAIGENPIYAASTSGKKINENNAKFWVDLDGNVHFKGTLEGANGTFSGELKAASGTFSGIVQASDFWDANGNSLMTDDKEKLAADFLSLYGIEVVDKNTGRVAFSVNNTGNTFVGGEFQTYAKDSSGNIKQIIINENGLESHWITPGGNDYLHGLVVHPEAVNYNSGFSFYTAGNEIVNLSRYLNDVILSFYGSDGFGGWRNYGNIRANSSIGKVCFEGDWKFPAATFA